jgi:hypothetical protein
MGLEKVVSMEKLLIIYDELLMGLWDLLMEIYLDGELVCIGEEINLKDYKIMLLKN